MEADVIGAEAVSIVPAKSAESRSRSMSIESGDAAAGSGSCSYPLVPCTPLSVASVRPQDQEQDDEIQSPKSPMVQPPSMMQPSTLLPRPPSQAGLAPLTPCSDRECVSLVTPSNVESDAADALPSSIDVVIDLDSVQLAAERHNEDSVRPGVHLTKPIETYEDQPEFLMVSRTWSGTSRFSNTLQRGLFSDEEIRAMESSMERKFATNKYMNFRTSFMTTSLAYVIGAWLFSIKEIMEDTKKEGWQLGRIVLLGGVVAPMYLIYFVCTWRYQESYHTMSGTWKEYVLWGLLCMHSLAIALADWNFTRKYGMLVMHISFVENFSPLGEIAMHTVTLGCAIIPYSFLKIFAYLAGDSDLTSTDTASGAPDSSNSLMPHLCIDTDGLPVLLLDIFVPMILLCYQMISTTSRDMSLRLDFLGNYQLQSQTEKLKVEKKKCEDLLQSMLPRRIIKLLMAQEDIEPQLFPEVTVIFLEICHFSHLCSQLSPEDVVEVLNIIYLEIDWLSDELHVYKVETVGQVYMAVVGCPDPVINHADVAAHFALAAQRRMKHLRARIKEIQKDPEIQLNVKHSDGSTSQKRRKSVGEYLGFGENRCFTPVSESSKRSETSSTQKRAEGSSHSARPVTAKVASIATTVLRDAFSGFNVSSLQIRVGLNSGRIRAGVVGLECPRYKLFGDTVNTASRMESTCEPGKVQMSPSTKAFLTCENFSIEERGEIPVKGKGVMKTAYIAGIKQDDGSGIRRLVIEKGGSMVHFKSVRSECCTGNNVEPKFTDPKADSLFLSRDSRDKHSAEQPPVSDDRLPLAAVRHSSEDTGEYDSQREASIISLKSPNLVSENSAKQTENGWQKALNKINFDVITLSTNDLAVGGRPHHGLNSGVLTLVSHGWTPTGWTWESMKYMFLLVPLHQKDPCWMATLKADRSFFEADTFDKQIMWARKITIVWLLILSLVSVMDSTMDVLDDSQSRYRSAVLFRAVGCNVAGMSYLMVLFRPIFQTFPQRFTIAMLTSMGAALLACGTVIYNSESAIIAMYGAYVLFYDICPMAYRMAICAFAVLFFLVLGWCTCGIDGVWDSVTNTAFLVVFFLCMACGLHLKEHLEHVAHFEQRRVSEKFAEIKQAQTVSSELLHSLLPPHVVEKVGLGIAPIAEHVSDVTILFTDMKGFTNFSAGISPSELVSVLNSMYSAFDEIIVNWNLYRVEIIGDAYFVSSGCPVPLNPEDRCSADENAMRAVEVALAMLRSVPRVCEDPTVQMRAGLHTGSVVAGVVGKKGPRYHLFGAAVQKAEFMESSGLVDHVHISDETHAILVQGGHDYAFAEHQVEKDSGGNEKTWLVKKGQNKRAFQKNKAMLAKKRQEMRSPRDHGKNSCEHEDLAPAGRNRSGSLVSGPGR